MTMLLDELKEKVIREMDLESICDIINVNEYEILDMFEDQFIEHLDDIRVVLDIGECASDSC